MLDVNRNRTSVRNGGLGVIENENPHLGGPGILASSLGSPHPLILNSHTYVNRGRFGRCSTLPGSRAHARRNPGVDSGGDAEREANSAIRDIVLADSTQTTPLGSRTFRF